MKKAIMHLDVLVSAMERTKKVKPSNSMAPIVVNWLFEFQKGTCKVTATDIEVYLSVDFNCECPEPFDCIVHPNALNLLKKMDSQPIVLEYNESKHDVSFVADGDRGTFQGDDPQLFPQGNRGGKKITGIFAADSTIFEELSMLSTFMSDDDLRPAMKGVYFDFPQAGIEMCATNGKILATSSPDHQIKEKVAGGFIMRYRAVKILASFAPKKKEKPVEVNFDSIDDGLWVVVSFGDITLYAKQVHERYPDFRSVIPKESSVQFSGDKATFLKQIDKALTCSNAMTRLIKLFIQGQMHDECY